MTRWLFVVGTLVGCVLSLGTRAHAQAPLPDGWVVLPVDEYRALRDRATPPVPPPPSTPVEATLTRLDYDLTLDGDTIVGRAQLTIDVLKDGWVRVPIPAGLTVRDARVDNQPVAIDGRPPFVLLSRVGRSILSLDIVIPLGSAAGTESFSLPESGSAISRATLVLPRTGIDLTMTGGFVVERADAAGQSRWVAIGATNQPMTLSWKRKVDDRRTEQPLRTRARVSTLVSLGEDISQVTTAVRVDVIQGVAREIVLDLPVGLVINVVDGPTVGDWTVTGTTLRVGLLEPSVTDAAFVVNAEIRAPRDGLITVPLIRVPAADRETGGVAIDIAGAGEVTGRVARGAEPADPSEVGDVVAGRESPSMIAFTFRPGNGNEARALTVDVIRYTPQAVLVANVEEARYRALVAEDGRLLVEARYAVRNNQRSFLKVTLPAGAKVWSAAVSGRPVRPGVAEGSAVLLPLEKGRAGLEAPTFVVEVVYFQSLEAWIDKGRTRLDLPAVDLPVSRTGVELFSSPRYRLDLQPGTFRMAEDPGPFADALRPRPAAGPGPPPSSRQAFAERADTGLQALADRYRTESGGRSVAGALPVRIVFPRFGTSLFLASELTEEARAPFIELAFKRTRARAER